MLSFFGFIRAGRLGPAGGAFTLGWAAGWRWSLGYALCAGLFGLMHLWAKHTGLTPTPAQNPPPGDELH